jgi:hypothetical protein
MSGGLRTYLEKLMGPKCHDKKDPYFGHTIPEMYAIILIEDDKKVCYDVRSFFWLDFWHNRDARQKKKITKKLKKLGLYDYIQTTFSRKNDHDFTMSPHKTWKNTLYRLTRPKGEKFYVDMFKRDYNDDVYKPHWDDF